MAMSERHDLPEPSEVELLLPWYVTGRLDATDRARVEAFLAAHPEMRDQLALVREERDQSVRDNEALGHPSPQSLDRLMTSLTRDPWSIGSVRGKITRFFAAPTPGGVRWAAAAAALLLLVQAAVIGILILQRTPDTYQTAGGPRSGTGTTLLVAFADEATAPGIAALLSELDAQIIEGPKPGGIYRLRLNSGPKTEAERQELVRRLRMRSDLVRMVLLGTD
jgi:hypothetical protein